MPSIRGHVNILISSAIDELPFDLTSCLAPFGRFIQILEDSSFVSDSRQDMLPNLHITRGSISFRSMADHCPDLTYDIIGGIISLLETGKLKLIKPTRTMELSALHQAFKLVLEDASCESVAVEDTPTALVKCTTESLRPLELDVHGIYVVYGYFGVRLCEVSLFLVRQGAKHMIVVSNLDPDRESDHRAFVARLTELGVQLDTRPIDWALQSDEVPHKALNASLVIRGVIQLGNAKHLWNRPAFDLGSSDFWITIYELEARSLTEMAQSPHLSESASSQERQCRRTCLYIPKVDFAFASMLMAFGEERPSIKELSSISEDEFFSLLRYAIKQAGSNSSPHIMMGFDKQLLLNLNTPVTLLDSIYSHLPEIKEDSEEATAIETVKDPSDAILEATTQAEVHLAVVKALQHKLCTVMAIEHDMIDPQLSIEDFGLDWLVMFMLRNWIFQNFKANLEPSEVYDSRSLSALASMILDRTTMKLKFQVSEEHSERSGSKGNASKGSQLPSSLQEFPRQPLPSLDESLQASIRSAKFFCSDKEREGIDSAARLSEGENSIMTNLQKRPESLASDPTTLNWMASVYLNRRYLGPRTPLVGTQSYFGTHIAVASPHSQVERAARVTLAALEFKSDLESSRLPTKYLNGEALDPDAYDWLFNASRVPQHSTDQLSKYPKSNTIIILHRGQAFKLELPDDWRAISFRELESTFAEIKDSTAPATDWLSILNTEDRDSWAEVLL